MPGLSMNAQLGFTDKFSVALFRIPFSKPARCHRRGSKTFGSDRELAPVARPSEYSDLRYGSWLRRGRAGSAVLPRHGRYARMRAANMALHETDLLMVFGARLDDRVTGDSSARFAPDASIAHFEIDPAQLDRVRSGDLSVIDIWPIRFRSSRRSRRRHASDLILMALGCLR